MTEQSEVRQPMSLPEMRARMRPRSRVERGGPGGRSLAEANRRMFRALEAKMAEETQVETVGETARKPETQTEKRKNYIGQALSWAKGRITGRYLDDKSIEELYKRRDKLWRNFKILITLGLGGAPLGLSTWVAGDLLGIPF